jgi:hypothetical protein
MPTRLDETTPPAPAGAIDTSAPTSPSLRPGPALAAATSASWILVGVMVVESLLGLLVTDLYPEAEWAVAALQATTS